MLIAVNTEFKQYCCVCVCVCSLTVTLYQHIENEWRLAERNSEQSGHTQVVVCSKFLVVLLVVWLLR